MPRLRSWRSSAGHAVELLDFPQSVPGAQLIFTVELDQLVAGAIARFERLSKPWQCLVCTKRYPTKKEVVDHLDWTHFLHVRAVHAVTHPR